MALNFDFLIESNIYIAEFRISKYLMAAKVFSLNFGRINFDGMNFVNKNEKNRREQIINGLKEVN